MGNVIKSIPHRTELTVLNIVDSGSLTWLNVTYENIDGWIVAKNGMGDVSVEVLSKPKPKPKPAKSKPKQRRYRKQAKEIAEE